MSLQAPGYAGLCVRHLLFTICLAAASLTGCTRPPVALQPKQDPPHRPAAAATFRVADASLPTPLVFVAYGDTRFTDPAETKASNPAARLALVARVAHEDPAAIFVNGDLTWHGVPADYAEYRNETAIWRDKHLHVYPALGNHEFSGCEQAQCLTLWWKEFPELQGRRWYSVAIGSRVFAVALDSNASLLPGSEQRVWLENQMAALDPGVRLVFVVLHHPPLADVQTVKMQDHNPRPNEQELAAFLDVMAARSKVRFIVSAGHIHNYERLERTGVVYLVSGGGGARPYEIDRTPADLYRGADFPNFHYVRFEVKEKTVVAEMVRLGDSAAPAPRKWQVRDRFELTLPP
jgi:acid phosphatase type 7